MCAFVTGGIWDKPRLQKAGYIVEDPNCELCGGTDSLEHRLWECEATARSRNKFLTEKQIKWLRTPDRENEREQTMKT